MTLSLIGMQVLSHNNTSSLAGNDNDTAMSDTTVHDMQTIRDSDLQGDDVGVCTFECNR